MSDPPDTRRWKIVAASTAGTSHLRVGTPCQDYSLFTRTGVPGGEAVVLTCSDGAGSATRAEIGARLACHEVLTSASAMLVDGRPVSTVTPDVAGEWYERARRRLSLEACITGVDLREYACTLLLAVADDRSAVFVQLGDGAIVFGHGAGYETACWPQSGEYANTTNFLTARDFREHLTVRTVAPGPDEVALLTDGLQPLALHYATHRVHAPFFDPMFDALSGEPDPDRLKPPLAGFLTSRPVTDRTDDDTTLVLATRRPPAHATA